MIAQVNGLKLYYTKTASGKPPLLLLHGNGESHVIFNEAIEQLRHSFTVYALDSRGHGSSDPVKAYHYADMASDVEKFILQQNLKNPVVYGFSDGAIIALLLAIHYPSLSNHYILSGVNTSPDQMRLDWKIMITMVYVLTKNPLYRMMKEEPAITCEELQSIQAQVDLIIAEHEIVPRTVSESIVQAIPNATLIEAGAKTTHGSYIVHQTRIAELIQSCLFCGKEILNSHD